MVKILATAVASALLAGCAVGPQYKRPDVAMPDRFVQADVDAGAGPADSDAGNEAATTAERAEFWHRFGDPLLSHLIEDALTANHDLRIGLARWDQAAALLRQSRLDRLPTVTAGAAAAHVRSSASQLPGVDREDRDADLFEARIDAGWELDLFGRVRRQVASQGAEADAAAADLHALQVAIVGELATSYLRLRGSQTRLEVARVNADNQRETLRVVRARLDAGQGTEFDTSRAQAQLASTMARIPALESAVAIDMHRIAVLTGRTPGALTAALAPVREIPILPAPIDAGTPADLLRRRPDIAAAERRLAAATQRVGVATADLFPRLTLGGALGSHALDAGALFERDSETHLISLGIDWSFLDIGRVRARIAAAEAHADEHLARYQQTVLRALEEAENALAVHRNTHVETAQLSEAAAASARATQLARVQFDGGLVELLQVLDAERIQLDAEDRLAQSMSASAVALIGVYRALGGSWPDRLPARSGERLAGVDTAGPPPDAVVAHKRDASAHRVAPVTPSTPPQTQR